MDNQQSPLVSVLQNKISNIHRLAEERDAQVRAKKSGLGYADLRKVPLSIDALKTISKEDSHNGKIASIEIQNMQLAVAVYNPNLPETKKILDDLAQKKYIVKLFIVSLSSLADAWHFYDYVPVGVKEITGNLSLEQSRIDDLQKKISTFLSAKNYFEALDFTKISTTDLFDGFLIGSLLNKASDIHFEGQEKDARVRYRIDGLLHDVCSRLPLENYRNLVSRVKLLSGLRINVRTQAQDGRYTIRMPRGVEIEVRVSIIPGQFGETIVMRILNPESLVVDLTKLGLRPDDLEVIRKDLSRPNGIILNTGPTGSGKTTTLYAFLKHVSNPESKIITIEDPIEYRVEGISQTQVDAEAGYTFASGLRSILRQDPDVILVGEIRDGETADIAMQAALTGHLVFSTLHTNDAIGAIPRLVDLGVRAASVGPAISVIIAQRLVRQLCTNCRAPFDVTPEMLTHIRTFLAGLPERVDRAPYQAFLDEKPTTPLSVYKPVGCDVCSGFGYKGRIAIFEFFRMSPELEEAILRSASEVIIRKIAQQQKMVSMQQDGILKALVGETSFSEVEEVTGPLQW